MAAALVPLLDAPAVLCCTELTTLCGLSVCHAVVFLTGVLCRAVCHAGGFPIVLDNLWLGSEEGEAIAAALGPKLQKTKGAVEQLLFEVATLEVGQPDRRQWSFLGMHVLLCVHTSNQVVLEVCA